MASNRSKKLKQAVRKLNKALNEAAELGVTGVVVLQEEYTDEEGRKRRSCYMGDTLGSEEKVFDLLMEALGQAMGEATLVPIEVVGISSPSVAKPCPEPSSN